MSAVKNAFHDELEQRRAEADGEGAYQWRMTDCGECGGSMTITKIARVRGEATDSEWVEVPCLDCVFGEVEAVCDDCLHDRPLNDDGICEPCVDANEMTVDQFEAKHGAAVNAALAPKRAA